MAKLISGAIGTVFLIIIAVTLPVAVGLGLVKAYRHFFPIEQTDSVGIDDIIEPNTDSFFKVLIIGWIVCAPFYYWVYSAGLLN
ncbi:hypothetical protein FLL45_18105 [Aliikangiella marina]|uniref:Uncharacterized protein n=1 Tax=Aliikangiella marina TaxID=1712262 RepID=A0A545T4I4_9GAMM|nr:hypothetical protein [Aliikangiella marina]TQV72134.1 hypothetical protein FLL45_18105 [Aliikangiella marina]